MRQYELAIRIAQIHHLVDERKYKKALAVIQTLDVRQVRALSDLKVFAEVYTKTEQFDEAKAMYLRICRSSKTRRVLHRLVYLSIRTNCLEDAEGYYREYMRMNPSVRDALILRYRIDKAAGVPIGKLIEVLQELKQEEYIEEWAYELAKLYHRAGRREECMEECKDIMLWFGSGEIVERAKILMDHLKERDPIPYYDDKDFTIPKKEEPNPDDTGSLPDLNEFIKERKALKREERRADRVARKAETDYSVDYKEEDKEAAAHGRRKEGELKQAKKQQESDTEFIDDYEEGDFEQELVLPQVAIGGIHKLSGLLKFGRKDEDKAGRREKPEQKKEEPVWEEEEQERKAPEQDREAPEQEKKTSAPQEEMSVQESKLPEQKKEVPKGEQRVPEQGEASVQEKEEYGEAKEVQKEEEKGAASEQGTVPIKKETPKKKKVEYIPHSQSGTGITQDLAKEITAIYEMEQQEQLKEKAVTVVREREKKEEKESMPEKKQDTVTKPAKRVRMAKDARDKTNIATNLVDRMTQAIQKSASKSYIPIDVEEIQRNVQKPVVQDKPVVQPQEKVVRKEPEPEKDPLTIALEKEVAEYQSAAKIQEKQNTEEKPENEEELLKHLLEEEIRDPERLQEPAVYEETEEIAGLADEPIETEKADGRQEIGELGEELEEPQEEAEELQEDVKPEGEIEELQEAAEPMEEAEEPQGAEELQETAEAEEPEEAAKPEEEAEEPEEAAKPEEETEEPQEAAKPEEEAEEPQEVAKLEEKTEEEAEEPQEATEAEEEAEEPQGTVEAEEEAAKLEEETEEEAEEPQEALEAEEEAEEEAEKPQEAVKLEEEPEASQEIPEQTDEISDMMESTKDLTKEIQAVKKGASILQDYHAPEIPVVETDYAGMPQITYEDLPTTRALQQSFQDVLRLIEGELDPSHFVLMGDGTERIVGVSKKIVHVMKASNYLSRGRIAKIRASQLNKMDLISFRKELRGNCLLIEEASDLLFPTITKIFSIMEEYAGDFVVILSDEGTTLDQLFRFVPVLAKRFKYIIDITKYTEKDYA